MNRFTYQIEPGCQPGTWQWQILDPRGQVWAYGARRDTKRQVEAMLKKSIARHNPKASPIRYGYNNTAPDGATRARQRGGLSAARTRRTS